MAELSHSTLRDFQIKEADTKQRLGKVFAAFIRLPLGAYFITGGKEPPFLFSNENFKCVCIGASSIDINEAEDILREIGSAISNTFSEADLHALVVTNFVSRVMQSSLEDKNSPRGVAAEFIIFDIGEKVLKVRYDGNIEIKEFDNMKDGLTLIGAYDQAFRRILLKELKLAPTDVTPKNVQKRAKAVEEVALSIQKKLKLEHVGVLM